jgi:hypothetical protein
LELRLVPAIKVALKPALQPVRLVLVVLRAHVVLGDPRAQAVDSARR